MSLTAGFGIGAGVAGILAQWAPWPSALAYLVHSALSLAAGLALLRAPETRPAVPKAERRSLARDLKIPAVGHRRFLYVVAPVAPWVFGAAASAYAVMPALMTGRSGSAPVAFSALLCMIGLGSGFAIQPSAAGSTPRRTPVPSRSLSRCSCWECRWRPSHRTC